MPAAPEPLSPRGATSGTLTSITLPNGMRVRCQTATEAKFIYQDIFEHSAYCRGGISLAGVETVLDVGANIGLFSLFVCQRVPTARVIALEPAPPLFAALTENTTRFGERVRCLNVGVARQAGRAELTFYPQSSGLSSFFADLAEEREVLLRIMENQLHEGMEGMDQVMRHREDLLAQRLRAERFDCALVSLSEVIQAEGLTVIDLLKIDVQKAEAEVLAGLAEEDWPKIRQIALEVHDLDGRLARLCAELTERGFAVESEQEELYRGSIHHNVYAVRRGAAAAAAGGWAHLAGRASRLRAAAQRQAAVTAGEAA